MARCETCEKEYGKAFEVIALGKSRLSIASNVRSMWWHPSVRTAGVKQSVIIERNEERSFATPLPFRGQGTEKPRLIALWHAPHEPNEEGSIEQ